MNAALAACAAACVVLAACDLLPQPDLERMIHQPRFEPFTPCPTFPDGRTMQPPPQGTVPRDRLTDRPDLTEGLAPEGGGDATRIPLPVTRGLLARGRDRFEIVCAACHGIRGDGESPVASSMELRKPPSLVDGKVLTFPPGRIFRVASAGYGLMPPFAAELTARDRWAVVAYLRALQLSQGVSLDSLPAEGRRAAEEVLR